MYHKSYPKEIKEEILDKVKNKGETVPEVGNKYGVNTKTIYRWLGEIDKDSNSNIISYKVLILG